MPKETINPRHHGTDDSPAPFVRVGWDRVGCVQVATLAGGDYDEVGGNARPGFYAELDRYGINRLIRTLRKARDQAFGADA